MTVKNMENATTADLLAQDRRGRARLLKKASLLALCNMRQRLNIDIASMSDEQIRSRRSDRHFTCLNDVADEIVRRLENARH